MAILGHVDAGCVERTAYLRQADAVRRGGAEIESDMEPEEDGRGAASR